MQRNRRGKNLDELLTLGALKQKQQSDEMIKNLGTEATQPVFQNCPALISHVTLGTWPSVSSIKWLRVALTHQIRDRVRQGSKCDLLAQR